MDENEFALVKIHTYENGSDMLTKILSTEKLIACLLKTGLVDSPIRREWGFCYLCVPPDERRWLKGHKSARKLIEDQRTEIGSGPQSAKRPNEGQSVSEIENVRDRDKERER